ncbi:lipopolysaccharide core heptose(II) kinase RfaY [Flavobacterium sp. 2]|uniref:lipopolysaccharide core heptose(II) kinase RfaY n=1 Tax=Flavobacterium sp. 2 TaxID=308053 RepID=UPI000C183162|nr:lipopolysaccharide core heptose(II) kinase RfaY [Flavobacterium sp. 2]PIF60055.1 protein kinase-like protein [Flavobacterium sp. 2]
MKIDNIKFLTDGGFGDIYSANDELDRQVVIKSIREASVGVSTPLQHAKALVRAKHPNVVEVYSIEEIVLPNETEPSQCIIMEYIEGVTLEKVYSNKISKEDCLIIGNQIINGLKHIHSQGLVHGDLHDNNIMVTNTNSVKVIDILYTKSLASVEEGKRNEKIKYDYRSLHQVLSCLIFNSELNLAGVTEFRNKSGLGIPENIETIETAFLCLEDFADPDLRFIATRNKVEISEIKEYKFRAECEIDVDELRKIMGRKCLKINKEIGVFPDTNVNLLTTLDLNELRNEMRKIDDGHVMIQTVALKEVYTGERDYDLE